MRSVQHESMGIGSEERDRSRARPTQANVVLGVVLLLAFPGWTLALQDRPAPRDDREEESLPGGRPAAEDPAEPLGEVLARIQALVERGHESRALDRLMGVLNRGDGRTLEELALMAEISLDLWLHREAANVALEALLGEGLSLSPKTLERPVVRRLARVYAKGLYLEARATGEGAQAREKPHPDAMTRPEMLSAAEEVLRRLTAAGTGDPEDLYWLAAVLVEKQEREAARHLLTRYQEAVPEERRMPEVEPMERCLVGFWQRAADAKGDTGAAEGRPSLGGETVAPGGPALGLSEGGGSAVQPPRKVETPMPGFTEAARRAATDGVVILETVIDTDGRPVCIRPKQGLPFGLTEKAVEAVSHWRFEPAQSDGEPVPVYYNLTVNYRLGQ